MSCVRRCAPGFGRDGEFGERMPPAPSACFLAGPVIGLAAIILAYGAPPALSDEHSGGDRPRLELTLEDAVLLVLRNNRTLVNAHLKRVTDRFSLRVAENKFRPHVTVGPFLERTLPRSSSGAGRAGLGTVVQTDIRTGGAVTLTLRGYGEKGPGQRYLSDLTLEFTQPLLRGAGRTVNTASVGMAQLAERSNILTLKQAVIDTVSSVAQNYRNYIQAERRVNIRAKSLERARELLEVNELLVRTGRMAARDIVQTQADIAGRELELIAAESNLDAARLKLLDILDIDSRTRLRLTDPLEADPGQGGGTPAVEEALQQRPDYLKALLKVRIAESNAAVKENERLWDLSLALSATVSDTGGSPARAIRSPDYKVGLNLSVPLGPRAIDPVEQEWTKAVIALRTARSELAELRQKIGIEVSNAVRDLEISGRQVGLARDARRLVEQKADVEREKLRLGLSSNFQLVAFEDDLVAAQNRELDAIVAWLNAETALDRTLGVTLDAWGIEFGRLERESR